MATNFSHPSYSQHPSNTSKLSSAPGPSTIAETRTPTVSSSYTRTLRRAQRACCCTAMPAVLALLPASARRPHRTDLLLCMHHYRAARRSLARAGATVIDGTGAVLAEFAEHHPARAAR
jgi:hypothetical protein